VLCMLVDDMFDGGQMLHRGIRTEAKQLHKSIEQSKAIDFSADNASRLDHHIQTILKDWDHTQDLCTEPLPSVPLFRGTADPSRSEPFSIDFAVSLGEHKLGNIGNLDRARPS
jgi:hypothetical protein